MFTRRQGRSDGQSVKETNIESNQVSALQTESFSGALVFPELERRINSVDSAI